VFADEQAHEELK